MAGQGPRHHGEGGAIGPADLLEQAAQFRRDALPEQVDIHARERPAQVIPEPAQAAAHLLNRRPVDAAVERAHQAQPQVGDHMLEQKQGFHAGVDIGRDAGLQVLGQAGQGFLQPPLALDGPVHDLHLGIQPGHGGGARLTFLQGRQDPREGIPMVR